MKKILMMILLLTAVVGAILLISTESRPVVAGSSSAALNCPNVDARITVCQSDKICKCSSNNYIIRKECPKNCPALEDQYKDEPTEWCDIAKAMIQEPEACEPGCIPGDVCWGASDSNTKTSCCTAHKYRKCSSPPKIVEDITGYSTAVSTISSLEH